MFSDWPRRIWWFLITLLLSVFLLVRYPDLIDGLATPADIIIFMVWLVLLMTPLFREINILGFGVKKEIDKLRQDVNSDIASLKMEVRNALDVRNTFNPQIYLPGPAPDSQLADVERCIVSAVEKTLRATGAPGSGNHSGTARCEPRQHLPVRNTFQHRERASTDSPWTRVDRSRRSTPCCHTVVKALSDAGLIEPELARGIREVYFICSRAIHAEPVSEGQVALVRDVGPRLIAALRAIS